MKITTNFLAAILVFCCLVTASAQRFGVKTGLNFATVTGGEVDVSMLPTFMIGGVAEFDFTDNVGLGVGLQVHGKGFDDNEIKVNPIYLQVPVQVQYRNNGFFAGVGPYVGFGIAGKIKAGDNSQNIEFGNDEGSNLAPLDFGAGVELGYEFDAFRATASYNLGLSNIIPSDVAGDESIKNNVIGISLAYLFGGK
jgi:hypothetical protein